MIKFILEIPLKGPFNDIRSFFIKSPGFEHYFSSENIEFLAWGDPIISRDFDESLKIKPEVEFILNNVYGHYYFILVNKASSSIRIGNSLFSILPVYYALNKEKIVLADNALTLAGFLHMKEICPRFILETILFNFPVFNYSFYKGIYLLASNSFLNIEENQCGIFKHTCIEDYFCSSPVPWKRATLEMRDLFIETTRKYLPEVPYFNSLTGGFDGRTLVSVGMYYKKDFSCYSFGSQESLDTKIASELSEFARIPFRRIDLNQEYVSDYSLDLGLEFIKNASGTATFARAHYLFAAQQLEVQTKHIVTGNFGSEVFRAVHNPGLLFSENLISLFKGISPEEVVTEIENSIEFRCLNSRKFRNEWKGLMEDLLDLPCFNNNYISLTMNQRFYIFVFEEVFRKYFGAEIVNQFKHLKNRTPFLDLNFLKAIFNTELAGIHSDFFEHNPLKRYKGQVLYAHILKKAFPKYGEIKTDKGYCPNDLLSMTGKLNIILSFLRKRINPTAETDPNGVLAAFEANNKFFNQISIPEELFELSRIKTCKPEGSQDLFFKCLSLSYLVNDLT